MKTKLIALLLIFGFTMISISAPAQEQNLKEMKQKALVVKIKGQVIAKKMDLEKELQNNAKITKEVESLNKQSNKATNKFSPSSPKDTAKDAKNTAKLLRKTEAANKDLRSSNQKIAKLEKDLAKLEEKLNKLDYAVELEKK